MFAVTSRPIIAVALIGALVASRAPAQEAHVGDERRYPHELVGRWVPDSVPASDSTHVVELLPFGGLEWNDGPAHGRGQWVVHWQSLDPAKPPTAWLCEQREIPGIVDCAPYSISGTAPARVLLIRDVRFREVPHRT